MPNSLSFGHILKVRRKALDLTQKALASRVGCALVTIKKIEADLLRPSMQTAERLADVLRIPTGERAEFLELARGVDEANVLNSASAVPPLSAQLLPHGTVTFLIADIDNSRDHWEGNQNETSDTLSRYHALLQTTIEAHNGTIFKAVDNLCCAVFIRAVDAVMASMHTQRALATKTGTIALQVRARMALHTGVAEPRDGDYLGAVFNRATCLLAAGHGGQVLLSLVTSELVRDHLPAELTLHDLGEQRLKDLTRPEHIFQVNSPELPNTFPPLRTIDHHRHNLPAQSTVLIGREREVHAVSELMRRGDVRLVTLTGPGGVGKTRLGLQVAADLLDELSDGIFFVPLSALTEPHQVLPAIAQTFGVRESGGRSLAECVSDFVRDKEILIVLDNFEHVFEAAGVVADLLAVGLYIKILVTSRAMLHISGEHEFVIPPLSLPLLHHLPTLDRLTQYDAVALFIARAQAAKANFRITNTNAPAVAEICQRLDGLPLAIELAAARIKMFTPQELLARLNNRLAFLQGGARDLPVRQQTLRKAIDWSYSLLSADEQILFTRLAVFTGGGTARAVALICNQANDLPFDVIDGLSVLVDQSLVQYVEDADGETRFVLFETIREYAMERLDVSGEAVELWRRHASYYLELAERGNAGLYGEQQKVWLTRFDSERHNLHAAFQWAVAHDGAEMIVRFTAAHGRYWHLRGTFSESRSHLETAFGYLEHVSLPLRAAIYNIATYTYGEMGQYDGARSAAEQSVALAREVGDVLGVIKARSNSAAISQLQGDSAQAKALYLECLDLARTRTDPHQQALMLNNLGELALEVGEFAEAQHYLDEALEIMRTIHEPVRTIELIKALGWLAYEQGDRARAAVLFTEGLSYCRDLGGHNQIPTLIEGCAAASDDVRSARLLGAAEALREENSRPVPPNEQVRYARIVEHLRSQLDAIDLRNAWMTGRAMAWDEAITFALQGA